MALSVWRAAILKNCDEHDTQTIELGMRDTDKWCRWLAYEKFNPNVFKWRPLMTALLNVDAPASERFSRVQEGPAFVNERLESVLKGDDKAPLSGFARNKFLSLDYLRKVKGRLYELGDDFEVSVAEKTIEELEKTQAPNDPRELFEEKGKFLENKIDFIGKKLLFYEEKIAGIIKALGILAAIWLGWKLLVWLFS